ncbi:uncharacterized protein LOC108086986 isoform X2 [Drosophila ficusphila]|uniref:uncharacterized protein LOC108086986 isoform X2 n=1 Tax=Drosophila ficusphila TaxID=30025 RepID=UPI0007E792E4|nr:uncharacterized protein LOC108086986 isoform X2 [Drosophila ficusphila]
MCRCEGRGPALITIISVIATISSVVGDQEQAMSLPLLKAKSQQRLPPDYVKGVLSLKGSLLANKHSTAQGSNQQAANSGIKSGMRYTPQLEVQQQPQSRQQEIQMPTVKLNRYSQEFPAAHLFQPPFVPLPRVGETKESQDAPPTAEQLELLQQLSDFFGQRQQIQQQVDQPAKCAQDQEGKELCDTETTTECSETTKAEDSVTVDVKNKETTATTRAKPSEAPKTKATKSTTQKPPATTRPTKSTTKKLPCCTKPSKKIIAEVPNVISFSLNIQNENSDEAKSLKQQPRNNRHAIQPDLRINAITNLLRYRRKSAMEAAPYPKPFSALKDQQLHLESRVKRKKDRVLDKNQLLQAELKIWPISIRSHLIEPFN